MVWIKVLIFVVLTVILRRIAKRHFKKRLALWKNPKTRLESEGWQKEHELLFDKTIVAVYRKGSRKRVIVLGNGSLDFEKVRKGLVLSALSNANELYVYCETISPHALKALELAGKNQTIHGVEIKVWRGWNGSS